jgi:hypothetical protein
MNRGYQQHLVAGPGRSAGVSRGPAVTTRQSTGNSVFPLPTRSSLSVSIHLLPRTVPGKTSLLIRSHRKPGSGTPSQISDVARLLFDQLHLDQ